MSQNQSQITSKPLFPQALSTSFIHRLKNSNNPLYLSSSNSRASKRSTSNRINYAEDYDFDFEHNDDENDDATYEDPNAAFDLFRLINSNVNLSNYQGKEAPKDLIHNKLIFSEFENLTNLSLAEEIIPIKIKINSNGITLRDSFLWNLNESLITPELFTEIYCNELELPRNIESMIVNQIKEQIQSIKEILNNPITQLQNEKEFHVLLDISVNVGEQFYSDKIEWNLLDRTLTPEMFAKTVVNDMGLSREFETAISFSIYDEILKIKRDLIENPQQVPQYIDSLPFFNQVHQPNIEDITQLQLQGLRYDLKKYGEEFSPKVEQLNEWEIEKRETEKERNMRRRKRETLRVVGGVIVGGDLRGMNRRRD